MQYTVPPKYMLATADGGNQPDEIEQHAAEIRHGSPNTGMTTRCLRVLMEEMVLAESHDGDPVAYVVM